MTDAALAQSILPMKLPQSLPLLSATAVSCVDDVKIDVVQRIADALGATVAALCVPASTKGVDTEIARRNADGCEDFVDAAALLEPIDEAARPASEKIRRYSGRGRLALAR